MAKILGKMQSLSVQKIQKKCLKPYLSISGKVLFLQSENINPEHFLEKTFFPHWTGITLSPDMPQKNPIVGQFSFAHIQSAYDKIPIRSHQFNLIIIPYVLEYCENPTGLIHEAYRCLAGEGKLLLFGIHHFHPWIWLNTPKPRTSIGLYAAKHLLTQSALTINHNQHFHYGSLYMIEAQKHIQTLIPSNPQWVTAPLDKIWVSLNEGKI